MPDTCAVPSALICPAVCRNIWRTPLLLGGDAELYPWSNYDAGVPPASFCVVGSQGPPCDPTLLPLEAESLPRTPTRSVRRASGLVLVGDSEKASARIPCVS